MLEAQAVLATLVHRLERVRVRAGFQPQPAAALALCSSNGMELEVTIKKM